MPGNWIPFSFWIGAAVLSVAVYCDVCLNRRVPWILWIPFLLSGYFVLTQMPTKIDFWSITPMIPVIVFLFLTGLTGGAEIMWLSFITLTQPWGQFPAKVLVVSFAAGTVVVILDLCYEKLMGKKSIALHRQYPFIMFILFGYLFAGLTTDLIL